MHAVFYLDPSARITSGLARYEGFDHFRESFSRTYFRNVGSMANPQSYGALCECGTDDRALPSLPHTVYPSFNG
jgi:hypothetical protein